MNLGPGHYFLISLVLTCAVSAALAAFTRRRRDVPGANDFFLLSIGFFFLAFIEILSLFAGSAGQALFWFKIRFIFNALIPVFFLKFVLDYTNRGARVSRRLVAGFFIVPLVTQVMVWTNDAHHLFVKREVDFVLKGPFWIADIGARQPGFWFLSYSIYGMILLLGAIILITVSVMKRRPRDTGQVVLIWAGGLIAFLDTLISAFHLFPSTEFNPFTPGLGLSFALIAIAVFRFRLFKRAPAEAHPPEDVATSHSLALFLLILAILASGIIAVGYVSFREFESKLRDQAENQLSGISELKADELRDWRRERMADGELLQQGFFFLRSCRAVPEIAGRSSSRG